MSQTGLAKPCIICAHFTQSTKNPTHRICIIESLYAFIGNIRTYLYDIIMSLKK